MALNAAVVFEVRTTGADTNGGGFKAGATGTDRSQSDTAWATLTTASTVTATTTIIQVAAGDYTVTAADVGNLFQINSGTATAGVYEITAADTTNNRWTLDRSAGTSTQTAAGKMGGAFATPGKAGSVATVSGQSVWVQAGTYTVSTTNNVAGGRVTASNGTGWRGYNATRGDYSATRPVIQPSANSTTLFTLSANSLLDSFDFQNNGKTTVQGVSLNVTGATVRRCKVTGADNDGFSGGSGGSFFSDCEAVSCSNGFAMAGHVLRNCTARSCTGVGINFNNGGGAGAAVGCVSANNTGNNFSFSGAAALVLGCVSYGGSGHGFNASVLPTQFVNCVAVNAPATKFGFNSTTGGAAAPTRNYLVNCAGYNNAAGNSTGWGSGDAVMTSGFVTLTADPFTSAAGLDFSLNATAGGGAALRAAGYPPTPPGMAGTSYPDVGVYQHGDPTLPAAGDVKSGVQYGAGGTQYTGTYTASSGGPRIHF